MKNKYILLFGAFISLIACGNTNNSSSDSNKDEISSKDGYTLIWSDEFDKDGVPDPTKWSYQVEGNAWEWGNKEDQFYTDNIRNANVKDGILRINALLKKSTELVNGSPKEKNYTSARLATQGKGDWLYGKFVIRAKLPTGRGTWPAIWMMPSHSKYGGWPSCGEIDIMENVGYDPNVVISTVHTEAYNHKQGTQKDGKVTLETVNTEFHDYSLVWDENQWSAYVDDTHVFTYKKEENADYKVWPFDQEFYLILNLAIGGGWAGSQGIDDSLFPHTLEVDYVRVYKKELK